MKPKRDYKKELAKLMDEQFEAFQSGTIEQRVDVFERIQKLQKERLRIERQND